ncbi:MAG: HAMP domain-containing protein [Anaerovibrio sp.]|uniref:methyl-accepting chemotaxis protein n=1 Tax=Anaerovibrio sp. TaxID=1872532 RepID=UPI0025CF24D4|nr:methyl-accepting chemotaxis protein [Anaerovibrio sp.]MCR5176059.1 HAMP domain-containing protein [Anaerovibrio sp.]
MMFFKNLKIGAKLIALVAFLELIIIVVAWHGVSMNYGTADRYNYLLKMDTQATITANAMGLHFNQARIYQLKAMTAKDKEAVETALSEFNKYMDLCNQDLEKLNSMVESDAAKQEMAGMKKSYNEYINIAHGIVNNRLKDAKGNEINSVVRRSDESRLSGIAGDITASITNFADLGETAANGEIQRLSEENGKEVVFNIAIVAVLILVSLAIGLYFARDLARRLRGLGDAAGRIADGDLATEVETSTGDELGDAAASFEIMRQRVHESVMEIHNAADQVAAGSKNVSDASLALSQGATEQAASVEELSASITEIAAQTANNASNADKANSLSVKAKDQAEIGNDDMKEMLDAMEEINSSSANISKIIKVIDEIAFQTNILALNAAVEAARAGQHGKGFAVVAEEVRNLAARSAKAAKETTNMIEGSIEKVNMGRTIANKTAEALNEIVRDVSDVADIVNSIAKASLEQKQAIDQINQGVQQVSQVVQANSATSEEAASASQELNAQADRMRESVSHFRLSGGMNSFTHNYGNLKGNAYTDNSREILDKPDISGKPGGTIKPAAPGVKPKNIILTDDEGFGKY